MTLKKEIEDILHPEKKALHPPVAPKPIVSEISDKGWPEGVVDSNMESKSDSKLTIDFNAIAQASEFQRFIYWILTGQTFRGSNKALKMKMRGVQNKIQIVRRLPPELLKELKEKLREIKIE